MPPDIIPHRHEGKLALVTGAGQGIGRGVAERFASEWRPVFISEYNKANAETLAHDLAKIGAEPLAYPVEISDTFAVSPMEGFSRQIPCDFTEAAYIDGCSRWTALWRVELPLAMPGVSAAAIVAFLAAWNEFQIAGIITRSNDARTFPPGLFAFTAEFTIDWRSMCAMSVLMMISAVIFVILTHRNLVRGLTFGTVKG